MGSGWRRWIVETFHQWVGYRVTEKEILEWMGRNGYRTSAADLTEVQLHALKRPGWVQVFRFQVAARDSQNRSLSLFGALRSDERYGAPEIHLFPTRAEREQLLQQWSVGLIVRR
jgi:hypothetical protein